MSLTLELCLGYAGASIPQGPCNKFCLGGIAPCACQGFFLALATLAHLAGSSCQLVSVALPWCPKSAWEKQLLLNSWEKQPVKSGMANPKAWGAYVKQAWQLPGNAPLGANTGKCKNAKLLKLSFGAGPTPRPGNLLPPWATCQTMSKRKAKTGFLREIDQSCLLYTSPSPRD